MLRIIAEAAVNHMGSLALAQLTSKLAKESGADFIKYQFMDVDELYAPGQYKYGNYNIDDVRQNRERWKLDDKEVKELFEYSREIGIPASATPFGPRAVELLSKFDPPFMKIASGDLDYYDLILNAASYGKKLIISTGMASLRDIHRTVDVLYKNNISDYVLMHCISIYPHNEEQSQIGFITRLRSEFGCEVGFSDHTIGVASASAAIALGATWVEKHFTASRNIGGLDAKHSLEPQELRTYVEQLRGVNKALEVQERQVTDPEIITADRAKRGLYAARPLNVGEVLRKEDLAFLRPKGDTSIADYGDMLNRKIVNEKEAYSRIDMNDVE